MATDSGAFVTNGSDWGQSLDRADGMPFEDLDRLAIAPNGDIWGGATEGAWRLRNGRWRCFRGKRWLPGNRVREIAFDVDGSVWISGCDLKVAGDAAAWLLPYWMGRYHGLITG